MKITFSVIAFIFLAASVTAQSVSVSLSNVTYAGVSVKNVNGTYVITENDGSQIKELNLEAEADDPSFQPYALLNGGYVLRENIANFLIVDSFGSVKRSVSNSTQSAGGEAISELSMDNAGKTIVVYNPKVMAGGKTGSRAKIIDADNMPIDVFYSEDRAISLVQVSSDGEFIAVVSTNEGSDDEIRVMDRFGNTINTISFDQEVKGVSFSENGWYLTAYSGGRVAAYEVRNAERVGSSSVRNTSVQFATYVPEDNTLIALTGSGNETLRNLEIRAINVEARKVKSEDVSGTLKRIKEVKLVRSARGRYTISGYDKELNLTARF